MIKKYWRQWLILGIVMVISFRISQSRSLSMHFADEEDHIVIANYTNLGLKLYKEIQSNHQPLVYFGSAKLQQYTHPDNIFMLIRRHRQAMYFYGLFWSLIIFLRFKTIGLVFVLLFEFLKYWLFGNLWLMESFAVYPAVYLFGVMLLTWLNQYKPAIPELLFLGICSFLVIFNLVPLWPWLILVWLVFLIKIKKKIFWIGGALLAVTAMFFAISKYSIFDWFIKTVYNNFVYAVPSLSPFKGPLDWLKVVLFPFFAYFTPGSLQAKFISLFFTGFLLAAFFNRKLLLLYPWLILANNRVLSPGTVYYQGFHLLPWLGLMIFTFGFSLKLIKYKFWPIFLIWGGILFLNKNMPYFLKTDTDNEYYINYSTFEDFNFAIKALTNSGDRTAVLTNEVLIQWQTTTLPATQQVVYYPWERQIPKLQQQYGQVFNINNPNLPEFIYGAMEQELIKTKYHALYRDGKPTELFIRNDVYENITPEEWESLETRRFNR